MNLKLVKIEWLDVTGDSAWFEFEDIEDKIQEILKDSYYTVGYLYKETKDYVFILPSISLHKDKDIELYSYEFIPKGIIKKITVL